MNDHEFFDLALDRVIRHCAEEETTPRCLERPNWRGYFAAPTFALSGVPVFGAMAFRHNS